MTHSERLTVIVKEPNKVQTVQLIEKGLEPMQQIVGGMIEMPSLNDNIDMVCNEEGKLIGLQPNLMTPYDMVVGTIIFIGVDNESGESRSLTREEEEIVNTYIDKYSITMVD